MTSPEKAVPSREITEMQPEDIEAQNEAPSSTQPQRIVGIIIPIFICLYVIHKSGDYAPLTHLIPILLPIAALAGLLRLLPEHKRASVVHPNDVIPVAFMILVSQSREGVEAICAESFAEWAGRVPCWAAKGIWVFGWSWWNFTTVKVTIRLLKAFWEASRE